MISMYPSLLHAGISLSIDSTLDDVEPWNRLAEWQLQPAQKAVCRLVWYTIEEIQVKGPKRKYRWRT